MMHWQTKGLTQMSHEITRRADGYNEMAYVGQTPWHGLGQKLEAGASIETWQTAAGMDWRILRSKVRYNTVRGEENNGAGFNTFDDKHVLFRSDDREPLAVVSEAYKVVQPAAILEFFRDLTGAAGYTLDTAGTLFGGKRFWALASIGKDAVIKDAKDRVGGYLLLSTSCDGSMATEARFTTVRVVCNNTLGLARYGRAVVKVQHRSKFDADAVKRELGIDMAHESFETAIVTFRKLAEMSMLQDDVVFQTATLFQPDFYKLDTAEKAKVLRSKPVERVGSLAIGGAIGDTMAGTRGTQWGWLNAVTQYVDHEARTRTDDNRLNSAWFGKGEELKQRALEMATAGMI
jgi:phage/plasmid-like protein (TIGR03299 family)